MGRFVIAVVVLVVGAGCGGSRTVTATVTRTRPYAGGAPLEVTVFDPTVVNFDVDWPHSGESREWRFALPPTGHLGVQPVMRMQTTTLGVWTIDGNSGWAVISPNYCGRIGRPTDRVRYDVRAGRRATLLRIRLQSGASACHGFVYPDTLYRVQLLWR